MCGRFVASRSIEEIVEELSVDEVRIPAELLPGPRFNISPQQDVLAVRTMVGEQATTGPGASPAPRADSGRPVERTQRRLGAYRWGLIPSWAKDPQVGAHAFNARAETLADKPMFRTALARRRCIIPADAFYEWQRLRAGPSARGSKRQPWCFKSADGSLLGLAGLYEVWRQGDGAECVPSCTIITTMANELMAPVHERMPVILQPADYAAWLAPGPLEPEEITGLLAPVPDDYLVGYRVGLEVGNSRAEGPQLVERLVDSSGSSPTDGSSASSASP
ncbi:MAG: SOS response-associated peptidase [Acidimicrobiales bacterium]